MGRKEDDEARQAQNEKDAKFYEKNRKDLERVVDERSKKGK